MKKLIFSVILTGAVFMSAQGFALSTEGMEDLMPLGSTAPDFGLQDVVSGKTISLSDYADKKAFAVVFLCRHCPFVQRVKGGIAQLGKDYADKNVGIVAISSNDPAAYPADAPESLKEMAEQEGFIMPLLFDETQNVAKAYTAKATPDFFVFDKDRKLVYRGQFDGARPGNEEPVTGKDVRLAIDAVLADQPVAQPQKPAIGCGIKWKK